MRQCDKQPVGRPIKMSSTEVVGESIPAYPVVVECTGVHHNPAWHTPEERQDSTGRVDRDVVRTLVEEEFLAELECLQTCEATYKNSE